MTIEIWTHPCLLGGNQFHWMVDVCVKDADYMGENESAWINTLLAGSSLG